MNGNNGSNDEKITSPMSSNWDLWRIKAIDKLKSKLKQNLTERRRKLEFAVNNVTPKLVENNIVEIIANPPQFHISAVITNSALDTMLEIIGSWTGVVISQCKKPPTNWKSYWRLADNWWNRQKGKWYGDLFFCRVLRYSLPEYTKRINIHCDIEYHVIYSIFLYEILHSTIKLNKKSKENPVIFDSALDKKNSANLYCWFQSMGQQHQIQYPPLTKKETGRSNLKVEYTRNWCADLKELKYRKYKEYKSFMNINKNNINNNNINNVNMNGNNNNNINGINNTHNMSNNDYLHPLGQPALTKPVPPIPPPQRQIPNGYNRHQRQSQQPVTRQPIHDHLPPPSRRRQRYYIWKMKDNGRLTCDQLAQLSQQFNCSVMEYMGSVMSTNDTSSTPFGVHQSNTPSIYSGGDIYNNTSNKPPIYNNNSNHIYQQQHSQPPQQQKYQSFTLPVHNNNMNINMNINNNMNNNMNTMNCNNQSFMKQEVNYNNNNNICNDDRLQQVQQVFINENNELEGEIISINTGMDNITDIAETNNTVSSINESIPDPPNITYPPNMTSFDTCSGMQIFPNSSVSNYETDFNQNNYFLNGMGGNNYIDNIDYDEI